jgi:hypothetical protein
VQIIGGQKNRNQRPERQGVKPGTEVLHAGKICRGVLRPAECAKTATPVIARPPLPAGNPRHYSDSLRP